MTHWQALRSAASHQGIQLSEHIDGADGEIVFRHPCKLGLEGIVAKQLDRPYRSGRSPDQPERAGGDEADRERTVNCGATAPKLNG